jgi:membrane-associated phospholipid phosphatase
LNREEPLETQTSPIVIPSNEAGPVETVQAAAADQIAPKPTRLLRASVFQAYLVVAAVTFGILAVLASLSNYFPIDLTITRAVQSINSVWFADLMRWVSFIGYAPQIFVLVAAVTIVLFSIGLRWESLTVLAAASTTGVVGQLIKVAVHRPRPGPDLVKVLTTLNGYSFPSGHVFTYTVFFGFLFFLTFTIFKSSFGRTVLLVIFASLVGLIGISRIYVGDHWASDVIAAYLLGSLGLVLSVYIYRWGKPRFFARQPIASESPGSVESKF